MKKKLSVVIAIILTLALSLAFTGCDNDTSKTEDYGTLTVTNVTLAEGEEKNLEITFSKPEKAEPVEYTFEGDAIEIKDGKIKALKGGETVTVTATTAHHTATFTVTIAEDYGTLTVNDIEGVMEGTTGVDIEYTFSNPAYAEEITYTFDGNDIEIVNGKINVLVGGKTVTVTAKTSHHETTFTVTTLIDYGELNFTDVYAWVGYPASELDYEFSKPERKEAFTYKYDATKLTIDAEKNTVKALVAGDVEVTVESEHFADKFTVHAEQVNKNDACYTVPADFNTRIAGKLAEYRNKGNDGHTTLFIGDSFFDERWFWTDFNRTYAGKDALIAGVSSSTTYDWEHFAQTFLKNVSPKQIAMHMGTNNVYDDKKSATETVSSLQRMFYLMHDAMPQTHIYWFNISQRSYGDSQIGIVATVNSAMKKWAANREWITLIDTSSKLTNDMLRDNVHPKLEYYSVFVNALKDAGAVIEDAPAPSASIADLDRTVDQRIYEGAWTAEYKGKILNRNYVISGKIDVTAVGNNPHIHFKFDGDGNRILLWDNPGDGSLKLKCAVNGNYDALGTVPDNAKYQIKSGEKLTITWKLVATDNDAYLYLNGELRMVWKNIPGNSVNLSSEAVACKFYDMTAKTLADDKAEYEKIISDMQSTIDAYKNNTAGVYRA